MLPQRLPITQCAILKAVDSVLNCGKDGIVKRLVKITLVAVTILVLINQGSASSAEIFAGAIQDYGRGTVVGETTFGTGTVLQPFVLDDGSWLMLGTSQWLTANGRLIRKQGIDPDVAVALPMTTDLLQPREVEELTAAELLEIEDAQLLKALELLGELPEN